MDNCTKKNSPPLLTKLNDALKYWCDENLTEGKAYRGGFEVGLPIAGSRKPREQQQRKGVLIYQDGTACSASHAFADVYVLGDGSYDVYMDASSGVEQGDSGIFGFVTEIKHCNNLVEVVDYLDNYCGHDPNSCGQLVDEISETIGKKHVSLSK